MLSGRHAFYLTMPDEFARSDALFPRRPWPMERGHPLIQHYLYLGAYQA